MIHILMFMILIEKFLASTSVQEQVQYILFWHVPQGRIGDWQVQVSMMNLTYKVLANSYLDIDEKSLKFADQNIHLNGLQNRIKLLQIKPEDPLIPLDTLGFEK